MLVVTCIFYFFSPYTIPTEAFEIFTQLQDLELSLNSITNISLTPDTFTNLYRLDLSYNNLSSTAITALGMMKELKELHLTGKVNCLC